MMFPFIPDSHKLSVPFGTHSADDPLAVACLKTSIIVGDPISFRRAEELVTNREIHEQLDWRRSQRPAARFFKR